MTAPVTVFGIHECTLYNPVNKKPYGAIQLTKGSTFVIEGETVPLMGGSNKFPWKHEIGALTATLTLKLGEFPGFINQLTLAKSSTEFDAESTGEVGEIINVKGTSIKDSAKGIASIQAAGEAADMKYGRYVFEAVTATTFNLYALTSADHNRGTPAVLADRSLKVNAAPMTLANDTASEFATLGISITGGSAVAMNPGDTVEFKVRPPNQGGHNVKIGDLNDVYRDFGALVSAEKQSDGSLYILDIYRLKMAGRPFLPDEKTWLEGEITAMASYVPEKKGVFDQEFVRIDP